MTGITEILGEEGFEASNSIALVSQCRDELTKEFVHAVDRLWGYSFNISSLAGMVFCGQTGFGAAMAHSPQDEDGVERYVIFVGPHIAISESGNVGEVMRPGRENPSSACGSLKAFCGELQSGKVDVKPNFSDPEQVLVKQSVMSYLNFGTVPSLIEVTQAAHDATVDLVKQTVETMLKGSPHRYALVSGILIHGPGGSHYFCPRFIGAEKGDDDHSLTDLMDKMATVAAKR